MVSRLLMFKMLHCKRSKQNNKTNKQEENRQDTSAGPSVVGIKIEDAFFGDDIEPTPIWDSVMICRVCLKEGNIPIFGDELTEDFSEPLSTFANIELSADDMFPKYLCTSCQSLLHGAILFRKTAQQSDKVLRKPKKEIKKLIEEEIVEDNLINNFDDVDNDDTYDFGLNVDTKPKKSYHCSKCDLEFKSLKEIANHRKSTDHKNTKYQCTICNKVYCSKYYKRHMAYHKLDTPYVCDVCGKSFIQQGHFSRHRMTHDYDLPYQCQICPYRGRFSESLKMHMRRHTGEKPYQCPECPVRCINKSNLNRHMNTHKKEHDFRCDSCGKGFFTKRDMELHFKVDHTGIKEHVCNICGKAFGYRKQMMKHQLKVHKREKLQNGRMPLYLQIERKKQMGEML